MKRLIVPCLFAFALTACGGGGGGSTGGSGGTVTPPTQPSAIRSVPTQRTVASTSVVSLSAVQSMVSFGGGSAPLSTVRRAVDASARRITQGYAVLGHAAAARRHTTAGTIPWSACSNSSETATVAVSATEEILYYRSFYDTLCQQLQNDEMIDMIASSSTSATASGTLSSYTTTGTQYAYDTLALSVTLTSTGALSAISVQMTNAVTPTSPPLGSIGFSCGAGSSSATCGFGAVDHSKTFNADSGATLAFSLSANAAPGGSITVPVSLAVSAYSGPLNALTLAAGTFPTWSISGGTLIDTASVSGQLAFTSAGVLLSGALTLTDAADHASVSMTTTTTGTTASISDTATNSVVATFTVDSNGNGTIAYSDGTTGQIVNWQVQS